MSIVKVDYGEVGGGISIADADFQYKGMSSSPTTFNLSDNSKIYLCFVGRTASGYESQTYASIIKNGSMTQLHNSLPSQSLFNGSSIEISPLILLLLLKYISISFSIHLDA